MRLAKGQGAFFAAFCAAWLVTLIGGMSLEEMNDGELSKLINQEQYVLVLFSKSFKSFNFGTFATLLKGPFQGREGH